MQIRPYILAGGKSSRMGADKAMLELEGKTLLARAVETLHSLDRLRSENGCVEVTICGQRESLEGADSAIIDRYSSCGPLGGIEAALSDLTKKAAAEWAFFIPVDMPLLSVELVDWLLGVWIAEILKSEGVRACLVEVDGRPQPLVSLVHRSLLGPVREALESGRYKVVPVLQSAGAFCASLDQEITRPDFEDTSGSDQISSGSSAYIQCAFVNRAHIWRESEGASRGESSFTESREQFSNVNTEDDFARVATLLNRKGSNNKLKPPAR